MARRRGGDGEGGGGGDKVEGRGQADKVNEQAVVQEPTLFTWMRFGAFTSIRSEATPPRGFRSLTGGF
ncbi:hypothetical protein FSARC_13740 [Fusarium sarcochroum]|uniref:Uncharacterized protein n=1 Tax=Fusarium sarcochroum TaxID=1208366 RepID=A0A8H4SZK8_9HYPO|nr:hypothetical protein FSARC_13740 [Fusarium sarcochroum]